MFVARSRDQMSERKEFPASIPIVTNIRPLVGSYAATCPLRRRGRLPAASSADHPAVALKKKSCGITAVKSLIY